MENDDLVQRIQKALQESGQPAWLFYDFKEIDPISVRILRCNSGYHCTRRWFYLVPAQGEPKKLVHRIEGGRLDHLPGEKTVYLRWEEFREGLRDMLENVPRVAMQYSPRNDIPYVSRVDAGTVEAIRECGTEVVSSGDLVQVFEAVWSTRELEDHRQSARLLTESVKAAFDATADSIRKGTPFTETDVQDFIMNRFQEAGVITDAAPIVGVGPNSGNPHYAPSAANPNVIGPDSFLLIDLWCKRPGSVFADITWNAYFGSSVPNKIQEVFEIVTRARDRGYELLKDRFASGLKTLGCDVDDAVREVIEQAGYGDYFVHRTGQNLGEETHGNGVNFDNLETHDIRQVITGIGCTIEPGIYLPEFGIRSEINIYMSKDGPEITTPPQKDLLVYDV